MLKLLLLLLVLLREVLKGWVESHDDVVGSREPASSERKGVERWIARRLLGARRRTGSDRPAQTSAKSISASRSEGDTQAQIVKHTAIQSTRSSRIV
jgi:hypothetical protein